MDTDLSTKESPRSVAYKRELERRSRDTILLYNPSDEDFYLTYDGYRHKFPAKKTSEHPRYIARNYLRHYTDKVIHEDVADAVEKTNKERVGKGQLKMTPEEQERFERPLLNNVEKRRSIYSQLWRGVVKEYGKDDIVNTRAGGVGNDNRPAHDKLLDELEETPVDSPEEQEKSNVRDMSYPELKQEAEKRGLEYSANPKKEELIDLLEEEE